jgi:hypothetical protein
MRAGVAGQRLTVRTQHLGTATGTPQTAVAEHHPIRHGQHGGANKERSDQDALHK